MTDELLDVVVQETNSYAEEAPQRPPQRNSRYHYWQETSRAEMAVFLALKLAMGITVQPLVADHWRTDWLFETPGFAKVMSRRRFQLLSSCLHFVNNATAVHDERGRHVNPLFKVRPVLLRLTKSFRSLYHPRQQVAIDEQMIAFKRRLYFKRYLPKKPTKWGLKAFVLAESATGYVYAAYRQARDSGLKRRGRGR